MRSVHGNRETRRYAEQFEHRDHSRNSVRFERTFGFNSNSDGSGQYAAG